MLQILIWIFLLFGRVKPMNNIAWSHSEQRMQTNYWRTRYWGVCLELSGRKWQEGAEKCLIYESHNCTVHQILLGWLKGWACSMNGRDGFGKASRTWSYDWHAHSVEIRDPEIVSPLHNTLFFMPLCLIKKSQLHLLVLVLPSRQITLTFNLLHKLNHSDSYVTLCRHM